jgi:hypothetical protein
VLAPETPTAVDSQTARQHADDSVALLLAEEGLEPGASVIELDSGHGNSWLPSFTRAGLVERPPTGKADVVVDLHHLMHETTLDPVLASHRARMRPGGRLVCEFFYARPLIEQRLVDTIRHGHFLYLSLGSFLPALGRHGLVATRAVEVDAYGGSLRVTARAVEEDPQVDGSVGAVLDAERACGLDDDRAVRQFAADARLVAAGVRDRLQDIVRAGRSVAAYGAPSKAAVLLALAGVDRETLGYTVDLSTAKVGRRVPGAGVPILAVETLRDRRPDVVLVLTWDIADEIVKQLQALAAGTDWDPTLYVPLPRPREFRLWGAPG